MLTVLKTRRISWVNVIVAGVAATIVVTITMLMSGTDIIKALGGMVLGMDAGVTEKYWVGGVIHFSVGLVYAVFFALFFAPVREWNKITKGIIFGFFVTVMALVFMPLGASMLSSNPSMSVSNPCAADVKNPCNPCMSRAVNPCAAANPCAKNPCGKNPCGTNPCGMKNPCATKSMNPCAAGNPCSTGHTKKMQILQPRNPCAPRMSNRCAAANPCNPCNGGSGNTYGGLISLVNHVILGLVLAFMVRLKTNESDKAA